MKQRISIAILVGNAAAVLGTLGDSDALSEVYYLLKKFRVCQLKRISDSGELCLKRLAFTRFVRFEHNRIETSIF